MAQSWAGFDSWAAQVQQKMPRLIGVIGLGIEQLGGADSARISQVGSMAHGWHGTPWPFAIIGCGAAASKLSPLLLLLPPSPTGTATGGPAFIP